MSRTPHHGPEHSGPPPRGGPGESVPPSTLSGEADPADDYTLALPADEPDLPGGIRLGRYEVFDEAARGGMGVVYRAADTVFDRYVAVKVLRASLRENGRAARRLVDEARITAQLQHPGVPPVYDVGELPDGRPYLVMKLVRGENLDDLVRGRSGCPDRAGLVEVFGRACEAVAHAHRERVIHRDLKPHNVMVGAFGEVKVLDWGLAKVLPRAGGRGLRPPPADGEEDTLPGAVVGTPQYMSPEQAVGDVSGTDERADVFGLGGVLCFLLTGRPPYDAGGAGEARRMAVRGDLAGAFARLDASGADPELVALCKRCLSADAGARPRDAGEVAAALRAHRAAAEHLARAEDLVGAASAGERLVLALLASETRRRRRAEWLLAGAVVDVLGLAAWSLGGCPRVWP